MAISRMQGSNAQINLWIPQEDVEAEAQKQLQNVASLPWVDRAVAVMPDVHAGKGATVGTVIASTYAVMPSSVGVDIGCGMGAVRTGLKASDLPDSLHEIRLAILEAIPVGFHSHKTPAFSSSRSVTAMEAEALMKRFSILTFRAKNIDDLRTRAALQLGTLGRGNHFIELCLDENDQVWLMLHSGSRNIGLQIAQYHIDRAKKLPHNQGLPDAELGAFFAGTVEMDEYLYDLSWAQRYAALNRLIMLELYQNVLRGFFPQVTFGEQIWCHHNYVTTERHGGEDLFITRKGAIRAGSGDLGIIPGSMGAKSFIVEGLGNTESWMSTSHGAGRQMSRGQAKKRISLEEFNRQTAGVECRREPEDVEEAPGAYKDIDAVMTNQASLVRARVTLHQVLCVKG